MNHDRFVADGAAGIARYEVPKRHGAMAPRPSAYDSLEPGKTAATRRTPASPPSPSGATSP